MAAHRRGAEHTRLTYDSGPFTLALRGVDERSSGPRNSSDARRLSDESKYQSIRQSVRSPCQRVILTDTSTSCQAVKGGRRSERERVSLGGAGPSRADLLRNAYGTAETGPCAPCSARCIKLQARDSDAKYRVS